MGKVVGVPVGEMERVQELGVRGTNTCTREVMSVSAGEQTS